MVRLIAGKWYCVLKFSFCLQLRYAINGYGIFFRKFDPRIDFFNLVIDAFTEAGIIDRFFDKYFPHKGIKEHENVTEEKLTIEHFLIPNIFLVSMLSISMAAMMMEVCCKTKNGKK